MLGAHRHSLGAHEATDATKYVRASSCRHSGAVSVAAHGLFAEPRTPGNGGTRERAKAMFPEGDRASVSDSAAAAMAASAMTLNWRSERPQVAPGERA